MSAPNGCWLTDFTAYDLPSEKWMKLFSPKMRLRVRGNGRNFVSSDVRVGNHNVVNQRPNTETCTHWPWSGSIGERSSRPSFSGNEPFEIFVERRFLLWHKCIQRTRSVTIDQVCAGLDDCDTCTLSLYDGKYSAEEVRDNSRVTIGEITFMLSRDDRLALQIALTYNADREKSRRR